MRTVNDDTENGITDEQVGQDCNTDHRTNISDCAVCRLEQGMTICKTIIEAHGDSLWIDNAPGLGNGVRVPMPFDPDLSTA